MRYLVFLIIYGCQFSFLVNGQSLTTIGEDSFYLSFEVKGEWTIEKPSSKQASMFIAQRSKPALTLAYFQYNGIPENPLDIYKEFLKRLQATPEYLIKYTKEFLNHEGGLHKEYYACGRGKYEEKEVGFLLGSLLIDNTNCLVLLFCPPENFEESLEEMKTILKL